MCGKDRMVSTTEIKASKDIGKQLYRECTLECSCALGTNRIADEPQRLQRFVLAACQAQARFDKAPLSIREKSGSAKEMSF
jgi:hypothetical protein